MDRNLGAMQIVIVVVESLSARRAWIEISYGALVGASEMSLSARRAWIEIGLFGVDTVSHQRRSPQGERG